MTGNKRSAEEGQPRISEPHDMRCIGRTLTATLAILVLGIPLNACKQPGRGTSGDTETGMAGAEGSTPFALGRTDPYQRAGMADVNIAASRAEAQLDTSASGAAELSRRAASATLLDPEEPTETALERADTTQEEIMVDRIREALGSTTQEIPGLAHRPSVETLSDLRITSRDGTVILRGTVGSFKERADIEGRVRQVAGVTRVINELKVVPASETAAPE